MIEGIEGNGNLLDIEAFINHDNLANVDFKKLETYNTVLKPETSNLSHEAIFRDILNSFGAVPNTVTPTPQPVQPIIKTKTVTPAPKIDETVLRNFEINTNVKKPQIENVPTDFERKKYNNILFKDTSEDEQLDKLNMLESVDELRTELSRMEEINLKLIPQVDSNSSYNDIKQVYRALLHKKNTSVHFETVRDMMLVGINQMVGFCNGDNGRPNLVGWDRTAKYKLNLLKTELSTMAGNFFKTYDIGPLGQILLSLVPSALLHMTTVSQQTALQSNNSNALSNLHNLL